MSNTEQRARAETFRRLHHAPSSMLVLPNAWDAATPTLAELAGLGVARVSFGGGLMRSVLGYLREVAREVLDQRDLAGVKRSALSGSEFESLFDTPQ
jgi:2-methylisocitrate lyase-like PEP mutase family enzyme